MATPSCTPRIRLKALTERPAKRPSGSTLKSPGASTTPAASRLPTAKAAARPRSLGAPDAEPGHRQAAQPAAGAGPQPAR